MLRKAGIEIHEVVPIRSIPKTTSGKIQRYKLSVQYANGAFETIVQDIRQLANSRNVLSNRLPENETEEQLIALCKEVFGVEQLGMYDRLLELGGNSLKMMMLLSKINEVFQVELTITDVFNVANLKALSQRINQAETSCYSSIDPVAEQAVYALSSAQKRMYVLGKLEENHTTYNIPVGIEIFGELDRSKIKSVINKLVKRHESLRTSFVEVGSEPVQRIHKHINAEIEYYDSEMSPTEVKSILASFIRPFDLGQAPLFRVGLIRSDRNKHMLLLDMHHIISDGTSMSLFMKELITLYQNEHLPEVKVQYKDFAAWQNAWMQSEKAYLQKNYWLKTLGGEPPVLNLPTDYPRPLIQSFEGNHLTFKLGKTYTDRLHQLAAETGTTLYMVLLSAYSVLLSKYSGQEDIIIGSAIAGRQHADLTHVIGMFVNSLAIRTFPNGSKTYKSLLLEVKQHALNAYEHQDYPFDKLVDELEVVRDISRNPLFDTMFVLQNMETEAKETEHLLFNWKQLNHPISKFDITLNAVETDEGIEFTLEYCTKLFKEETMERFIDHYVNVLAEITADPVKRLSDIEILSSEERHQLLMEFNDTKVDYPKGKTIHQLFEEQAERTPDHTAVVFEGQALTYRELNERANQLARVLRHKGVRPDKMVGIMVERSLEMVIGIMGILKAGGAYVPIDPAYPQERISYMLEDSGIQVLLLQANEQDRVNFTGELVLLDVEAFNSLEASNLPSANRPSDLAYVIYTSGTTGKPKGTLIEHKNVVRLLFNSKNHFDFNASDVWTLFHSYCFDFSVWEMYGALLYGGKLVIVPQMTAKSPQQFLQLLIDEQVTILNQTPTYFYQLMHEALSSETSDIKVRNVIFGGEALNPQLLKGWKAKYPQTQLINMYGITETTVHVTYKEIADTDIEAGKSIIGQAIPTLSVYILDEQKRLLPIGVPGEMYVAGEGVTRGYLNRPQLTAEKFVSNPFRDGEKMYRTGDLARWLSDGNIEYLGRIDYQVKIRGYRIELGEIESQLTKHEQIKEAVVIAIEDRAGEQALCAYFTANVDLSVIQIRTHLCKALPDYMLPSYFVQLDAMPLTPNGKIDRKALPKSVGKLQTGTEYVAPRNITEEKLVRIWQEVLGLVTTFRIGIHDNFFELGGHSLKATTLVSKIHREFNVNVPLREVFTYPTIQGLAKRIEDAETNVYTAIAPAEAKAYYAVSSAQKRMYVLNQLEGGDISYNMPAVLSIAGRLNKEALTDVFETLIKRHESLRTSFEMVNGELVQKIHATFHFEIETIEMPHAASEVQKLIKAFVQPFDLATAPLFRVGLIQISAEEHLLFFDMHHIISDGTTMGILVKEMAALYNGAVLPELTMQYKDYSEWQNAQFQSEVLEEQKQFWLNAVSGELPVLDLPTDYSRPSIQSFEGASFSFTVDGKQSEKLQQLGGEIGGTLYMVLLSAYTILLSKYTGQEDIVVGSPVAGRRHADLEHVMGMFVNTLAMRNFPVGDKTYLEFLEEVKQHALAAYEHQDYPFEELVEQLHLKRDMSRNPLFDVMFVLQNTDMGVLELSELTISPWDTDHEVSKFDLTLTAMETDKGIAFTLEYCTKLFKEETIERLSHHYVNLLSAITANPEQRLGELEMMTAEEKQQLLVDFNAAQADYPKNKMIDELFEEQVECRPEHVAVVFEDQQLTYRELNDRANQLAHLLRGKGVGPDRIVGIMTERSLGMVVGILGVLKAGGAYLPIDPVYPEDRIQYMLEDSGVELLLTQRHLLHQIEFKGETIDLEDDATYMELSLINKRAVTSEATHRSSNHLAYVIYTSGSTGKPKGVMIEHHSIVNLAQAQIQSFQIKPTSRILQFTSFSFDVSVSEIFMTLLAGAGLYMEKQGSLLPGPDLIGVLSKREITTLSIPSSILAVLKPEPLPSLETIIVGGDICTQELVERWGNGRLFFNCYGPTEAAVCATMAQCEVGVQRPAIGQPIANTQVYILSSEIGLQPIGAAGELCIAGAGLARGYLNKPELTAEKFVDNPLIPGERMYRTGDLARWLSDGTIEYLGRLDHQVKVHGYRIELGEIESWLVQYEPIQAAVVVVREDHAGDKALCACFTAQEALTISQIRKHLLTELPEYMVPSYFIQMEELPLTPTGKIDRRALQDVELQMKTGTEYAAPRNEIEEALVAVWQGLLGVERIGIQDHFFELGGDSIKGIQMVSRLNLAGYTVDMQEVFRYPRIAELSKKVTINSRRIENGPVQGEMTLTPIQSWFFEQHFTDQHHWNQTVMLYREQGFNAEILQQVFVKIVEHHDALRLVFKKKEDGYHAWNRSDDEGEAFSLDIFDVHAAISDEGEIGAYIETKANDIQSSIDLENGPVIKLGLFHTNNGDHLLICIHHLVIDGISWRILFEDIAAGYNQALEEKAIVLPPKTDSFLTWSKRLRTYAQGEAIKKEVAYWKEIEAIGQQRLPRDMQTERRSLVADNAQFTVTLTVEETQALLKQSNKAYHTEVNDLLLTALGLTMSEWTGLDKVVVNLEGHGRESVVDQIDVSRTIGWFTTQFPVVLDIRHEALSTQIKRVKEHLHRIPNHGIGYGILKYLTLSLDSKMGSAEPEISFNYLGQLDADIPENLMSLSPFAVGASMSPNGQNLYVLNITGMVVNQKLQINFEYSVKDYKPDTIKQVGTQFKRYLLDIIAHCSDRQYSELTPTDMVYSYLSLEQFETLQKQISMIGAVENIYSLTPMQKGMLFHGMKDPKGEAYFEQFSFSINGRFQVSLFEKSLKHLIERREVLRTVFSFSVSEQPLQIVFRERPFELRYEQIGGLNIEEQEIYIENFKKEDRAAGFDFAMGPLMRVTALETAPSSYHIVWSFHHILMDGWCLPLILKEVFQIYQQLEAESILSLPEVVPFGRYIEWLQTQNEDAAAAYWKHYLQDYEQVVELPKKRAEVSKDYEHSSVKLEIGKGHVEYLRQMISQHQITMNTLLQTAWGIVLQKYNRTDDVVFGSVVSGRPSNIPGIEEIIGLFINTIPVRITCGADETFMECLQRNQSKALESAIYEYYPLYEIQSQSAIKQDLINHIMVFENYPVGEEIKQAGRMDADHALSFGIENVDVFEQTNYDLNLVIFYEESLQIEFKYNALVYDCETIERIKGHLEHVLHQVMAQPTIRVQDIELLTAEEKQQILVDFNDTVSNYPKDKMIHELFEEQAERTPDDVAVVFENQELTYQALNERANQMARLLRSKGVGPDQVVGIMAERSLEMIIGIMGILKAGGAYMPIDPAYPADRIHYMLEDSGTKWLLTESSLAHLAEGFNGYFIGISDDISFTGDGTDGTPLEPLACPEHLAYIIYTSGTTGKPKGVMVEHRNVVRLLFNDKFPFDFGAADVWTLFHSFCFDFSVWEMYGALLYGGKLVIVPKPTTQNPAAYLELLKANQVTILNQTPTAFHHLMEQELMTADKQLALRTVIFGGEALAPGSLKAWKRKYHDVKLVNMYGITETTVHVTYKLIDDQHITDNISAIGAPLPTLSVYVLDQYGYPVPVGVLGEMFVSGHGVARGYVNNSELTTERFIENPFVPGERMYRTGDLARWLPEGELEYLGRRDDQVKIRGFRIELGEIEAHLQQINSIQKTVVMARNDSSGNKYLCAYFVAEEKLDISQLRHALSELLPNHMIPSHMIQLEAMPVTSNGKVDRKALPEPDGSVYTGVEYIAPSTELQTTLVRLWEEILGVKQIGIMDNFFDLGGDSFKVMQLSSRMSQEGYNIEIKDLLMHQSIDNLSKYISNLNEANPSTEAADNQPNRDGVLVSLLDAKEEYSTAIICVPYGGGSFISYKPLAEALVKMNSEALTVYGVNLPGHEMNNPSELMDVAKIAQLVVNDQRLKQHQNIMVYGHCVGSGLALEITRLLEHNNMKVTNLYIGASLLGEQIKYFGRFFDPWALHSDQGIMDFLVDIGGERIDFNPEYSSFIINTFRHDVKAYARHMSLILRKQYKVFAPISVVIGKEDKVTRQYERKYKKWKKVTQGDLHLVTLDQAHHYFLKSHAKDLASIILKDESIS